MTRHLLVHVTGMKWEDIRKEITTPRNDGHYRTLICPDIGSPVIYVDDPFPLYNDSGNSAASRYTAHIIERADTLVALYPPEKGYVGVRMHKGQKRLWFRDTARFGKGWAKEEYTAPEIFKDLRSHWEEFNGSAE